MARPRVELKSHVLLRLTLLAISLFAGVSHAQAEKFNANYDLAIAGIRIGKITSSIELTSKSFEVNASVQTAGLAASFAKFSGTVLSKGIRTNSGKLVPTLYTSDQTHKNNNQKIKMIYKNEDIISTQFIPSRGKRENHVPVTPAHLEKTKDPLVSLLTTATDNPNIDLKSVCNQTIRIYDANERYDLKLRYHEADGHRPKGYDGPVVSCKVRYIPVSGHNINNKSIKKLAENKSMRISFIQLGQTNTFLVSSISLKVGFGRLTVKQL